MSWQVGPFTMALGGSASVFLSWGRDPGIQVIQVLPETLYPVGSLVLGFSGNLNVTSTAIQAVPNISGGNDYTYTLAVTSIPGFPAGVPPADPVRFVVRGERVD